MIQPGEAGDRIPNLWSTNPKKSPIVAEKSTKIERSLKITINSFIALCIKTQMLHWNGIFTYI